MWFPAFWNGLESSGVDFSSGRRHCSAAFFKFCYYHFVCMEMMRFLFTNFTGIDVVLSRAGEG